MLKLNKKQNKSSKPRVYISRFLAILALSFGQLIIPLLSLTTNADATRTKIARYEALRVLTSRCLGSTGTGTNGVKLNVTITTDQYSDSSYSPLLTNGETSVSALLFDTNSISCAKALSLYYETTYPGSSLAESRQNFIKDFYDTSRVCTGEGGYFTLKGLECNNTNSAAPSVQQEQNKLANELLSESRSYMLSLVQGDSSSYDLWRDRIISYAFNECYKFQAKNPAEANPDRKAAENWVIQNSNASSNAVGWMAEQEITGGYTDGRIGCDEIKSYIFPNHTDLIGFADSDLKDELQEQAKEKAALEIYNKIMEDSSIMSECAKASSIPTTSLNASQVASWLAFNDADHPFPVQPAPDSTTLSNFKACLLGFTPDIKTILEDLGTISDNVDDATEAQEEANDASKEDDCLSKADAFLAWFACPIINLVDSFLEKIQDIIQRLLAFDLDKQATHDGTLRDAWNIFRSLATVLIMAGFLLALVVKGVRGE